MTNSPETNWEQGLHRAAAAVATLTTELFKAENTTVEDRMRSLLAEKHGLVARLSKHLQSLRDGLASPVTTDELCKLLPMLHECIDWSQRVDWLGREVLDRDEIAAALQKTAARKRGELARARDVLVRHVAARPVPAVTVAAPVPQTILDRDWLCSACSAIVRSADAMLLSGHRNGVVCRACFEHGVPGAKLGGAQDPSVTVHVAPCAAAVPAVAEYVPLPAAALAELQQAAADDHAAESAESPAADLEAALDRGIDWEPEA